jgi:hypothetical protein
VFYKEASFWDVIMEGNVLRVVKEINYASSYLFGLGHFVELRGSFTFFSLSFLFMRPRISIQPHTP